jgi:hypothetical protein
MQYDEQAPAGTYPMTQLHPMLYGEQAGKYRGKYILKIMYGKMHGVYCMFLQKHMH